MTAATIILHPHGGAFAPPERDEQFHHHPDRLVQSYPIPVTFSLTN